MNTNNNNKIPNVINKANSNKKISSGGNNNIIKRKKSKGGFIDPHKLFMEKMIIDIYNNKNRGHTPELKSNHRNGEGSEKRNISQNKYRIPSVNIKLNDLTNKRRKKNPLSSKRPPQNPNKQKSLNDKDNKNNNMNILSNDKTTASNSIKMKGSNNSDELPPDFNQTGAFCNISDKKIKPNENSIPLDQTGAFGNIYQKINSIQNEDIMGNKIREDKNNKEEENYYNNIQYNNSINNRGSSLIQKSNCLQKCFVSYSLYEFPNTDCRPSMEDFHSVTINLGNDPFKSLFAIFDGHSGTEVAEYLKDNFHNIFLKEITQIPHSKDPSFYKERIISSMISSFQKIDSEIINNKKLNDKVGSTGTVIFLYKDENISNNTNNEKRILVCANVGDTKAYLISKNYIKQITNDHNCKDEKEVERIKNSGGLVFRERVFGSLMVTRTFGDKEFKKYGVLSEPSIFCKELDEEDLFVVAGSDGAWDVISEDEIFEMSKNQISSFDFCQKMILCAKERATMDNVTCLVVKLNKDIQDN